MLKFAVIFIAFLFGSCLHLKRTAYLDPVLNENSGLVVSDEGIWFINDSGNPPYLYKTNFKGKIIRRIHILNAQNNDWEALCSDKKGNFYIGDIGNNLNKRKDLCIYKIPNPDSIVGNSILAEVLLFRYEDQQEFPPGADKMYFDAEAMVTMGDSLYIFTKNRSRPHDGLLQCYTLPMEFSPETIRLAQLKGSFRIKKGFFNAVTDAVLSEDEQTLFLLSMKRLYKFEEYEGSSFFKAKKFKTKKLILSQKESIGLKDRKIIISDEKSLLGKARVYKGKLR